MKEKFIAHLISYIFHPLLIPTYSFILLFQMKSYISHVIPLNAKITIIAIVFLNSFILPVLMILFMKYRKLITHLSLENKRERTLPYIVTAIFYFSTYYLLKKFHLPSVIYIFMLGSAALVIVAMIVNFWWKISAHMIGIGGLVGAFIGLSFFLSMNMGMLIALMILVAGLIGFSRLKLQAHSQAQIYTGFLLGCGGMGWLFYAVIM